MTRYFGIGEKSIIKFNGPSDRGVLTVPGRPINIGNRAATNLKINTSSYFSTPLTFSFSSLGVSLRAAVSGGSEKGLALFTFLV